MTITGTTLLTGVVGWPISQSRSPLIHNHWFQLHAIDGVYVGLPTGPDKFGDAIKGLQAAGFRGLNVTAPHKENAVQIADVQDDLVRRIGASNTLSFTKDGKIAASNTDSSGFLRALKATAPKWQADKGPAVVLGAGGAARAVIAALIDDGVQTIRIVNRSIERAQALQSQFDRSFEIYGCNDAGQSFEDAALLVNSTTLGMQGHPRLDVPLGRLPPDAVVNDLVNAPLETDLLKAAKQRGLPTVDGLGMLLHQAAASFEIWFGIKPEIDAALRDYVLTAA